ncbi:caspase family protein [Noviherbaspirillum saxi]|uniref:Peptidase C14 caspase domain-containing protein n=1 Tax=Noviherbaspirillum saxi TaxID=2320863 RepID=A0A3A3FL15_9BURK|nr:caspase family protein [Noviherbaspirillum saxi]RJF92045.1 hypothetical protein D3871_25655 [Noviherbaspirillum saxi]
MMIGHVQQIDIEQLRLLLRRGWTRRINAIHLHHTWRPSQSHWAGAATMHAIDRFHGDVLGWQAAPAHLYLGPDGSIWTARNLDCPPASVAGHNGDLQDGPMAVALVGDFDHGRDTLCGKQEAVLHQVLAEICTGFLLGAETIRFPSEMISGRSSPGSGLNAELLRSKIRGRLQAQDAPAGRSPSSHARAYASHFGMPQDGTGWIPMQNAEPPNDLRQASYAWTGGATGGRDAREGFTPGDMEVFRRHVVNLQGGHLSSGGWYQTSEHDLDRLIADLDAWALTVGATPRIALIAHGGLVDEPVGLSMCLRDYQWWLGNGVYPVFFVWETGFIEVLLQGSRRELALQRREFFTDPFLEATLGPTIGRPTWDGIKASAFMASLPAGATGQAGGAALMAHKLVRWIRHFKDRQHKQVEVHAIGHSAGAIFHCHLLTLLAQLHAEAVNDQAAAPAIKTVNLLAPAARIDLFKATLLDQVGKSIGELSMFTMYQHEELRDDVIGLYRKSLLYFVRNACETPPYATPILGLEESIRADPHLNEFFGISGNARQAEVIWSPSVQISGRSASRAYAHGDFDNDAPTMNSVIRRILRLNDTDAIPVPHLGDGEREIKRASAMNIASLAPKPVSSELAGRGGRALCIGIDSYSTQPLSGCVADARASAVALEEWGFTVELLLDRDATRAAILARIAALLDSAGSGDMVVIQYAGHGTQFPNPDEPDGYNEVLVPYDYNNGEFILDDEVGSLLDQYRDRNLELVLFTDCCHCGTITRAAFDRQQPQRDRNSRYMKVPDNLMQAFLAKYTNADQIVGGRAIRKISRRGIGTVSGWELHYAACNDQQSAYEHGGRGDFTVELVKALAAARQRPSSYAELAATIARAFSGNALQSPGLNDPALKSGKLLFRHGVAQGGASMMKGGIAFPENGLLANPDDGNMAPVVTALRELSRRLDRLDEKIDRL